MYIGLLIVSVYLFLLPYFKVNKDYQRCVTPSFAQFAHSIDVKKRFYVFFILVTFLRFDVFLSSKRFCYC